VRAVEDLAIALCSRFRRFLLVLDPTRRGMGGGQPRTWAIVIVKQDLCNLLKEARESSDQMRV